MHRDIAEENGTIESLSTVDVIHGSKADLFEQSHPVVKELREIPGLLMEDQIESLPSSAISLKQLFTRKQMDFFHVDCLILYKIARRVLRILTELSRKNIFPGLIGIEDFYVDMNDCGYETFLLHPQKFQLLHFEQDYEWYPEDERIFGEIDLFDKDTQLKADNRLMYKILVASTKGNIKIPPKMTEADYSELFYKTLPDEWRQIFESGEPCEYADMRTLLDQCIKIEETFAKETKKRLDDKAKKDANINADSLSSNRFSSEKRESGNKNQELFCMFVILRTELEDSRTISKMLYLLQDELEIEACLSGKDFRQAFVFGNGVIHVKEFAAYYQGYRCQFQQKIKDYSAGEALIIGADMMEEKMSEMTAVGDSKKEFRMYILVEGSLKNDRIFRYALKRLEEIKQPGLKIRLVSKKGFQCEACQKLKKTCAEEVRHVVSGNKRF